MFHVTQMRADLPTGINLNDEWCYDVLAREQRANDRNFSTQKPNGLMHQSSLGSIAYEV